MNVTSVIINLTSEDPARLQKFYREVVGLPPQEGMGEGALILSAGATLIFDGHSETHGPTKEPQRVLLDLFVEDLAAEQRRLEGQGVKFIRSAGQEYWGGVISTFLDPDGNYCQLMEFRPELAQPEPAAAATNS
ncbi:MAG: VOC family protein [Tepidiformaceae bacterium]